MLARVGSRVPALKDGSERTDVRADYIHEHDERNAAFPVAGVLLGSGDPRRFRSYSWRTARVLDQRSDGACVGFAWAHELISRPVELVNIDADFAREKLYYAAQRIDRWPGGEYPGARPLLAGTSVLAGAKVVKDLRFIEEYRWAESVWDLAAAVGQLGPAVVGCSLHEGMRTPDGRGFIRPVGPRLGGHAYLVVGVRIRPVGAERPDPHASTLLLQNSWGTSWGRNGRARITLADMRRLWDRIEACVPITRRAGPAGGGDGGPP